MIRFDCRHYVGYKPCMHKRLCDGCGEYDPVLTRILIIKLGALGDLFRTTPVLPSLKSHYPRSQITWLTRPDCVPLLKNLRSIDRIWVTDANAAARVLAEHFDLVVNFDKDTPAAELASIARATQRKGFALTAQGALNAVNTGSQYALDLGLDDDLKFRRNAKTYQQIIHEMADLPVPRPMPNYQVSLSDDEKAFGAEWLRANLYERDGKHVLGINPGAGRVFATKKWHPERYAEAAVRLHREHGVIPMILGGADEAELNERMTKSIKKHGVPVLRPGESLDLRQFLSIVAQCDGFLSGDTLAMHMALSQGVRSVVLFTSTSAPEIELYGHGRIVVGRAPCAPCYLSKCKQPAQLCADDITVDAVVTTVAEHMGLVDGEKLRRSSNL